MPYKEPDKIADMPIEIARICFACQHFSFKKMACQVPISICHSEKVRRWRKENKVGFPAR